LEKVRLPSHQHLKKPTGCSKPVDSITVQNTLKHASPCWVKVKGLLWQIQLIKLITNCGELILFFSAALKHALSRKSCHASNNIFSHLEQQTTVEYEPKDPYFLNMANCNFLRRCLAVPCMALPDRATGVIPGWSAILYTQPLSFWRKRHGRTRPESLKGFTVDAAPGDF